MDENQNPNNYMQDIDEEEETLSFCDLPIYGNSDDSHDEDLLKEEQSFSLSSEEDKYFEFFSATTASYTAENIIFCGKLIPYKQPTSDNTQKLESSKQQKPRKRGLFRWKPKLFVKPKTSGSNKYGFSVRRVSILRSPSMKSRWYLFVFGLTRFPTEMDLCEMKNRQSRRRPSTLFRSEEDGGGDEKLGVGSRKRSGKGLWGLIRALSCGGHHHHHHHHANAVV